jgi:hypothetical protein
MIITPHPVKKNLLISAGGLGWQDKAAASLEYPVYVRT